MIDDNLIYERLDYIKELTKEEITDFLLIQFGIAYGRLKNYIGIDIVEKENYTKKEKDRITSYYFWLGRESIMRDLNNLGFRKQELRKIKEDTQC